jgi:hypothetical protein
MQNINQLSGNAYYEQLMKEIEQEPKSSGVKIVRMQGDYGNDGSYNGMSTSSSTTFSVVGMAASAVVN